MVSAAGLFLSAAACYGAMGAMAQTSTAELFIAGFDDSNSLSGAVVGTGAEGTTYILEGVDVLSTTTLPFTMTLVEGAAAMIETAVVPGDDNFGALAACSFVTFSFSDDGSGGGGAAETGAVCAEIVQAGATTTTIGETFALSLLAVPVSTDTPPPGLGPVTLPSGASASGSVSGGAKSTITSVVPSVTGPKSTVGPATSATTTATSSAVGRGAGAGAMMIGVVALLVAAL